MTVMGIIGCRVFEDEIVHVLSGDPEVERVYLVKNKENIGLQDKLKNQGLRPLALTVHEIKACLKKSDGFSVIVQLQEIGLHSDPSRLKNKTYTNLSLMSGFTDGILLYGLWACFFKDAERFCIYRVLSTASSGQKHRRNNPAS